jgi:hypothetical protein
METGVLQSPMHAPAAEQSDAEAEERAGLRPWRMGAVGCMAAKAPGRARRKGSNGRDGLASCLATTRRKRKPHGQRRVAQCERFNCSCGKQSRSDVIPLLSFHMQTNGGCADNHWRAHPEPAACVAWVQNFPTRLRQLLAGGNLIASLGNPCVPPMRPRARRGGLGDDPDEMAPGVITSMDADDEASRCSDCPTTVAWRIG